MKAATSWAQMGLYTWGISIHAAREGGDIRVIHFAVYLDNFNPRRP